MVSFPLIMVHARGNINFRENSIEFIKYSNNLKPDIIELDIRKSKDNVIFCLHGSIILGQIYNYFSKYRYFHKINKNGKINTLSELLSNIDYNPILYLDLKQSNITFLDIDMILSKFKFKKIYIAAYSLPYLENLMKNTNNNYKYSLQIPLFRINKFLKDKKIVTMVKVWRWDINKIKLLREKGYEVKLSSWFYFFNEFIKKSVKVHSFYVCISDVDKCRKLLNSRI